MLERFVVLEGIDGSGKSYQTNAIKKYLNQNCPNLNIVCTSEPTNTHIGAAIKQLLKEPIGPLFTETKYDTMLTCLFLGDRYLHLFGQNGIIETIKTNQETIVICDRYLYSSLAYHDMCNFNFYLNKVLPVPGLVFFLDIDPKLAIQRKNNTDNMENLEKLTKVAKKYKTVFKQYIKECPETKFITIDASLKKEDVTQQIVSHLSMFFRI